jgi:hypothetical protein
MTDIWNHLLNLSFTGIDIIIIVAFIILILFITIKTVGCLKDKSYKKEEEIKATEVPGVNLDEGQLALNYLDRLIKEKYQYYLYLDLLPIYLDRKIPEKNIISKIKEKIYVSIVGSLTREVKHEILKYFTEKGIEIYVNERIIVYMNETDFQTAQKYTEYFREINANDIDKIL